MMVCWVCSKLFFFIVFYEVVVVRVEEWFIMKKDFKYGDNFWEK